MAGSWLTLQDWPQVEDLGLVFALHDANKGHLLEVCLRSESSGFHDGFKHGRRPFEHDFSRFLHGAGDDHRHGPGIESNNDFVIL